MEGVVDLFGPRPLGVFDRVRLRWFVWLPSPEDPDSGKDPDLSSGESDLARAFVLVLSLRILWKVGPNGAPAWILQGTGSMLTFDMDLTDLFSLECVFFLFFSPALTLSLWFDCQCGSGAIALCG
jgi:hypothetical protein